MNARILGRPAPVLILGLLLAGCDDATSPHPDKVFTDGQRASCPASPFKPEFPIAPKRSAEARIVQYSTEIYTSRGKFIDAWEGTFDPDSRDPYASNGVMLWDGKDAAGRPVPSGYYFFAVVFTFPETGATERRTPCIFYVNQDDQGKMK